jgi:UDP-N-acetylglucosamine--N-acetylmuramyl-(pentapeptide) pyrophosphoryl-undecaprenol N-acetylglucosamine transferase
VTSRDTSAEIFLTASAGGHLDLLQRVQPALADRDRVWVTSEGARAAELRERGERVEIVPEFGRNPARLPANLAAAARLVAKARPRFVLTAGAGVVLPIAVLARLAGARVVFLESMARVRSPTASGRVVSRFAARTIVQWPELRNVYPRTRLARPALLEGLPAADAAGAGTFVAVGTHAAPFDRLLRAADEAVGAGILPRPAFAQSGACRYKPRHIDSAPWLSGDEMAAAIRRAGVVVAHGGAGIVSSALRAGKRPLVMSRDPARNEHVDAHQEEIVGKLGELSLLRRIGGRITPDDVDAGAAPGAGAAQLEGEPLIELVAAELGSGASTLPRSLASDPPPS